MAKKGYLPENTRSFALVGHRSSGKTSVGDCILHAAGATRTQGSVDQQTSLLDFTAEARRRKMSIEPSFAWVSWKDTLLHFVDTPGCVGLMHQTDVLLANTDAFVLVVSASDGVEAGTERVLERTNRWAKPGVCVLNKCDRPHLVQSVMEDLRQASGLAPVLMQLPFYDVRDELQGVVDLLSMKLVRCNERSSDGAISHEIPKEMQKEAAAMRERLVEAISLTNDALLEQYLEYLCLDLEQVRAGLVHAVRSRQILPVYLMSVEKAVGVEALLDVILEAFPAPDETPERVGVSGDAQRAGTILATCVDENGSPYQVVRIWSGQASRGGAWRVGQARGRHRIQKWFHLRGPRRSIAHSPGPGAIVATWEDLGGRPGESIHDGTTATPLVPEVPPPMIEYAVRAKVTNEVLAKAFVLIQRRDHGIGVERRGVDQDWIMAGQSQLQLERAAFWLKQQLRVPVDLELPTVCYRETIRSAAENVESIHERTEGGLVEEFGACVLTVTPGDLSGELVFDGQAPEEQVPSRFIPSIQEGLRIGMMKGPTGFPVTGLRIRCSGGDYDIMQSKEEHFMLAAERGLRMALIEGGTRILEPWKRVEVFSPQKNVGAVLAELTSRRSRIAGLEISDTEAIVRAECPVRDLRTFAPRLSAITGGRGWFTSKDAYYAPLPENLVSEAITSVSKRSNKDVSSTAQGVQVQRSRKLAGARMGRSK